VSNLIELDRSKKRSSKKNYKNNSIIQFPEIVEDEYAGEPLLSRSIKKFQDKTLNFNFDKWNGDIYTLAFDLYLRTLTIREIKKTNKVMKRIIDKQNKLINNLTNELRSPK